jgi:glutamate carboxypeptidase
MALRIFTSTTVLIAGITSTAILVLSVAACGQISISDRAPSPVEQQIANSVDVNLSASQSLLEQLVNINSGTMNFAGVDAVKNVLAPKVEALGFKTQWHPMQNVTNRAGDLIAEHPCPMGKGKCGQRLLLIGHLDTVFELSSKFQRYAVLPATNGNVATGPGINDMKGGIVIMLAALTAMKDAGVLEHAEIRIVLSGDEERAGAPIELARKDMIEAARQSDVALEFEPSVRLGDHNTGQDTISIGRRSSTTWHLETTGISGHSSQIFGDHLGYGAIYELARILDTFRRELPEPGLTFSPGLVLGGATAESNADSTGGSATGKANVVAPSAMATGDIRTLNNEQTQRVEAKMQAIVAAHLPKTNAKITFDEGYPAMAATDANRHLFDEWNQASLTLGLGPVLEAGPMTRGAGDIAFVASYVNGLVGTGMLGEGAHAEGEIAYLDALAKQAKRSALLMERLSREPSGH